MRKKELNDIRDYFYFCYNRELGMAEEEILAKEIRQKFRKDRIRKQLLKGGILKTVFWGAIATSLIYTHGISTEEPLLFGSRAGRIFIIALGTFNLVNSARENIKKYIKHKNEFYRNYIELPDEDSVIRYAYENKVEIENLDPFPEYANVKEVVPIPTKIRDEILDNIREFKENIISKPELAAVFRSSRYEKYYNLKIEDDNNFSVYEVGDNENPIVSTNEKSSTDIQKNEDINEKL